MTTSQTIIICSCILSTALISIGYQEYEKAPARAEARKAQEYQAFQKTWSDTKNAMQWLKDDLAKRDFKSVELNGASWLYAMNTFAEKYPTAPASPKVKSFTDALNPLIKNPTQGNMNTAESIITQAMSELIWNP
jgi:hypothetical protein